MKKPRKRLLVVTAAVAATLLVASCSYGSGDPSRSQASGGAQDGNVSFATTTPNWILPVSAPGKTQGENAMFTQLIYPALFSYKLDAKNEFNIDERHSVAKPPTVSDDSLTYTITLKDRTWSDGVKLTTRDMEFWWNIVTNNTDKWASYRKGQFPDNVKAFKIIDDKAFTITTTEKYNPAWFINNQLNRLVPMPAHAWSKTSDSDKPGEKDRAPAGAKAIFKYLSAASEDLQNYDTNKLWKTTLGPFQLGKYTPNGKAKLVASPSYDGEDKASISSFTMQPYTSDDAEFNILRSGSIDYGFIPPNSMTQQKYIEKQGYTVKPWYGWSITYMPFNFNNPKSGPIFAQKYIRQAMQHLIDQEGISKIIWNRTASPTCGPVPQQPGTAGSSKGCAYDYNPAKAEKLLKDHGWNVTKDGITTCQQAGEGEGQCGKGIKQGAKLSFTVISQSGFTSTTHMFAELKSSFSNVGINLEIREVPDSVAESQACKPNDTNCKWDLSFFGSQSSWYYPVYASGERLFQSGGPVNLGSYSDKKADELIDASMRSNDRTALKTYNAYLAEDLPVLWMPNPVNRVSAWKSNIQGIDPQDPMLYLYPQDWTIR